ncbi:MAG: hypothetical protein P8076_10935 [Gammaproteobacteria bacterium]
METERRISAAERGPPEYAYLAIGVVLFGAGMADTGYFRYLPLWASLGLFVVGGFSPAKWRGVL